MNITEANTVIALLRHTRQAHRRHQGRVVSTSARERSGFGQFQLNRSAIDVGTDYSKVRKQASIADMTEMLRDGATLPEVCEAFGLSTSTIRTRLADAGWSCQTGQPLDTFTEPEIKPPHASFGFIDQPWVDQALCAQTDPEIFFPEKGGSTRESKNVCAQCFVAAECLDYAMTHDERFGVWGGLSERERRTLKSPGPVPCTHPSCDRRFTTKTAHDQHFRIAHKPPTTLLACPDCDRSFAQPHHLGNHACMVHTNTERTAS